MRYRYANKLLKIRVITTYYHSKDLYQIVVYQRYGRAFKARGVDCRFFPETILDRSSRADLFIVQEQFVGPSPGTLGRPIIVEERQDSAMPLAKELVGVKNVVCFFKPGVVISKYINVRAERVHLWLLDREGEEASSPW